MGQQDDPLPPFRWYDDDSTALCHVLWSSGVKGTDADRLAEKLMRSPWYAATRHPDLDGPGQEIAGALRAGGAGGPAAVDRIAGNIERSRWLAATVHRAAGLPLLCENGLPDGHGHAGGAGNTRCLLVDSGSPDR